MSLSDGESNYKVLFGLSADTNQYEYHNHKHFLSVLSEELDAFIAHPRSRSQYIIFTGVNEDIFRRYFVDPDDGLTDFETYSIPHRLILVKMKPRTHAFTHRSFGDLVHGKLLDMNIKALGLVPFGSAHIQGKERIKRADEIYQPTRLPKRRTKHWPSFVVEVGYSDAQRKLQGDVDWWMNESSGDVKSVVTIATDRTCKEITICQWNRMGEIYRNVLSQDGERDVRASNQDPLVIAFDDLFLRRPSGIEKDIIIPVDELKDFAEDIWEIESEV